MSITTNEFLGLAPITALAFMYWLKEIYLYNRRLDGLFNFSRVQFTVLSMYLIWIALTWFSYLAIARGDIPIIIAASICRSVMGWYTLISIVNENFIPTRQQVKGLCAILIISLTWDATNYLILAKV